MGNQTGFPSEEEFEKWVTERENVLFNKARFKEMGKENDYMFQILVFMGKASQQMSLGYTIAGQLEEMPQEIKDEMRAISIQYQELQDKIRELNKEMR